MAEDRELSLVEHLEMMRRAAPNPRLVDDVLAPVYRRLTESVSTKALSLVEDVPRHDADHIGVTFATALGFAECGVVIFSPSDHLELGSFGESLKLNFFCPFTRIIELLFGGQEETFLSDEKLQAHDSYPGIGDDLTTYSEFGQSNAIMDMLEDTAWGQDSIYDYSDKFEDCLNDLMHALLMAILLDREDVARNFAELVGLAVRGYWPIGLARGHGFGYKVLIPLKA